MVNRKKKIISGIATNYLQYILATLLAIVLSPVVLKYAGKETMGAYAILLQLIAYVGLVDMGFGYSTGRFVAQAYAKGKDSFNSIIIFYRSIAIIQNLLMAVVFYVLSFVVIGFFNFSEEVGHNVVVALRYLSIWRLLSAPWMVYYGILYATNNMSQQNIAEIFQNASKIILSIIFVYFGYAVVGLIISQIISQLLGLLIKYFISLKKIGVIPFKFQLKYNELFKEILFFSLNSFLITIAIRLVFTTDNLVIGYLFGPLAVTTYYLTYQPGRILQQIALRITDNFFPSFNELFAQNRIKKIREVYLKLLKLTFIIAVPISFGIGLFTKQVVTLWVGADNYLQQPMAIWSGIFAFTIIMGHVANAIVMMNGKIKTLSYFALFEGVLNIVLSVILAKLIGLHGIMLATVIANIPTTLYLLIKSNIILKIKFITNTKIIIKYLMAILIIPLGYFLLDNCLYHFNISLNIIFQLLIFVFFLSGLYFLYIFSSLLNHDEKIIAHNYFLKLKLVKYGK